MKLTQEELDRLAPYEQNMRTALHSKYLRNVGRSGLAVMIPIYERATGYRIHVNDTCGACILDFLQRLGRIYFADKDEINARNVDKEASNPLKRPRRSKYPRISEGEENQPLNLRNHGRRI